MWLLGPAKKANLGRGKIAFCLEVARKENPTFFGIAAAGAVVPCWRAAVVVVVVGGCGS